MDDLNSSHFIPTIPSGQTKLYGFGVKSLILTNQPQPPFQEVLKLTFYPFPLKAVLGNFSLARSLRSLEHAENTGNEILLSAFGGNSVPPWPL
jgi:hypothetical protein